MRIFTGRAGSGKTNRILHEIANLSEENIGRQILIVPELYSHAYERRLAEATHNHGARTAEVLSFTRLCTRVFAQAGGLAEPVLTPAGRLLTVQEAGRCLAGSLVQYNALHERPELLRETLSFIDEMKTCCVLPERLFAAAQELEEEPLHGKLLELGQIYTVYDRLCQENTADPRDALTLMAERLAQSGILDGVSVYIDCFASFTPQETIIIERMLNLGVDLTVAITCDEGEPDIFVSGCKTAATLRRMTARRGQKAETIAFLLPEGDRPSDLAALEAAALRSVRRAQPSDGESLQLFAAASLFEECEHAAAFIRKTVRETGAHWRDFAVTARDMSDYAAPLAMAMARYGVPIFQSEKPDILQKPALALVTGALDAAASHWRYEDLFACFKTGLCGLTNDEIDRLENYALTWRIRGGAWEAAWTNHPGGYGLPLEEKDRAELELLNALRARAITPFIDLRTGLKEAKTAGECVRKLYAFLEAVDAPHTLAARADAHAAAGRKQLAEEYRQLWDIVIDAMEQVLLACGDREIAGGQFAELFRLVLAEYDVGTIPVSLDRVTCGEFGRVCTGIAVPHLIILGATDSLLPKTPAPGGVLTETDRDALDGVGLTLAPGGAERLLMEQETIYKAFACARKTLLISYSRADAGGGEVRPSYLIGVIRDLLFGVPFLSGAQQIELDRLEAERPAVSLACTALHGAASPAAQAALRAYAGDERIARAKGLAALRGRLTVQGTIEGLYGRELNLTASRVDTFYSCRAAFFLQYGLRLRPRKEARFAAPETGTFIHYCLENALRLLGETEGGVRAADAKTVKEILRQVVKTYVDEVLGGLADKTARFRYLFDRLVLSMETILRNVLEELAVSDFAPIDYELDFSHKGDLPPVSCSEGDVTVALSGKVDRVDGYIKNGKLYLRIMDYKSGKKAFSLSDIWYGLNMQLIIYLYALQEKGLGRYRSRLCEELNEIVPAGVLYVAAREELPDTDRAATDEQLAVLRDKALRRSGLLSDDMDLLEAMEHGLTDQARFLPVEIKMPKAKKGEPEPSPAFTAKSMVAGLEKFGKLARYTHQKLLEMGKELRQGSCAPDPYRYGEKDYCKWCDYHAACHFDETAGDRARRLKKVQDEAFWQQIGGELDAEVDE